MCNMNKINRMISKYNYTPGNSSRINISSFTTLVHWAEQKRTASITEAGTADHRHIILSGLTVKSGSVWKIRTLPGIAGRVAINIRNAEMPTVSGLKCACEKGEHKHLEQRTGTGISKIRRCSQLLSWFGI